jgi:hypothetical protein
LERGDKEIHKTVLLLGILMELTGDGGGTFEIALEWKRKIFDNNQRNRKTLQWKVGKSRELKREIRREV